MQRIQMFALDVTNTRRLSQHTVHVTVALVCTGAARGGKSECIHPPGNSKRRKNIQLQVNPHPSVYMDQLPPTALRFVYQTSGRVL